MLMSPWQRPCFGWPEPSYILRAESSVAMSIPPRPIPDRPDETPRPGHRGLRTPYTVNDPGFADPKKPGSEPDYIPGPSPAGTPDLPEL
jgi:hypothetical protein